MSLVKGLRLFGKAVISVVLIAGMAGSTLATVPSAGFDLRDPGKSKKLAAKQAQTANVFLPDGRKAITQYRNYFWPIVHIYSEKGGPCTSSLVGDNLVLTAAHCVLKNNKMVEGKIMVSVGYQYGTYREATTVIDAWFGSDDIDRDFHQDWAILLIADDLGDKFDYFGIYNELAPMSPDNEGLNLAGFSDNFQGGSVLGRVRNCEIRRHWSNGLLYHDCDSGCGSSGGPIYKCPKSGGCYIVCLNQGEYRDENSKSMVLNEYSEKYANTCIHPKNWAPKLKELREIYN